MNISKNLTKIQEEIAPCKPKIIAVTKYFDESGIIAAYESGIRDFAENRVVDACNKFEKLPEYIKNSSKFHLIGHLQTNKVKKAVGLFELIHSVDSLKLANTISEEALSKNIVQKILLQINNADEEAKYGLRKNEIEQTFAKVLSLKGVQIEGLMTIAPLSDDEKYLQKLFQEIIQIKDNIEKIFGYNLREVSMGMSNDYKIAAREGATIIRIGRKLFN